MPPHPCSHLLIECKMAVSWLCMCVLLSASLSAFAMPDEDLDNAVGLIESVDVSDEGVQIAASFACQNNNYNLLEVLKAERQVVGGFYYYLSVMVDGSSQSAGQMKCDFEVYDRPWEESISIEKSECTPQ
ncbi:cystatin-C-like [Leucoraja erinacea]|uniref:cystatin-C-like n=1 Tax=Leucoraja erinaceus TaxID=7782 RepID=UPI0024551A0F|nr:cystatin-C-like [Leucoraja erinacea]XP_055495372.1 cystatin-C-like [Leucoraja erinacea]